MDRLTSTISSLIKGAFAARIVSFGRTRAILAKLVADGGHAAVVPRTLIMPAKGPPITPFTYALF